MGVDCDVIAGDKLSVKQAVVPAAVIVVDIDDHEAVVVGQHVLLSLVGNPLFCCSGATGCQFEL